MGRSTVGIGPRANDHSWPLGDPRRYVDARRRADGALRPRSDIHIDRQQTFGRQPIYRDRYASPQCWHSASRMKKYGCRIAGCRQQGQRSDRNRLTIRLQTMNQPANKPKAIASGASWPAIDRYAIKEPAPNGGQPIHQRKNNARQRFTVFQNSDTSIAGVPVIHAGLLASIFAFLGNVPGA